MTMKNSIRHRGAGLLAAVVLLAGSLSGCGAPAQETPAPAADVPKAADIGTDLNDKTVEDFILCAERDGLKLFVKPANGEFYVEDTASGAQWYSNPAGREKDTWAEGVYRMELSSALIVQYYYPDRGEKSRFNTATGSVYDETFTISAVEGGVRIEYRFEEYQVTIPLYVYLQDGALRAQVPTDQIKNEDKDLFLYGISVLPYFGAGSEEDTGYLLVPDGSGGLIDFNNGKEMASYYMRPIYGMEPTEVKTSYDLAVEGQDIKMPVFGIRRNQHAFLAVVEDGAEIGTINANGNRQLTSFANVYTEFAVRGMMNYSIGSITTPVLEKGAVAVPSLAVRYTFLGGEDADYSGMARAYHDYLRGQYGLQETASAPALYAELYAGVKKTVSRLGIQMDVIEPLTTTGQAQAIAEELRERGIDQLVISYRGWNRDELENKPVTGAKVAGSVQKGGVSLRDLVKDDRFRLYPALNTTLTYANAGFFTRTFDTVCDISGVPIRPRPFRVGLGDEDGDPYYYITYDKITDAFTSLRGALKKGGLRRAAFDDLARVVYNDYRSGNRKRTQTRERLEQVLGAMAEELDGTLLYSPNVYALPYASELFGVPTSSSGHDLIDHDVPFYQIAVSGFTRYACQPLNNGNVGGDAFLKAVETGSSIAYTWIYEDVAKLKDTSLGDLSGSHFAATRDEAVAQYQRLQEVAAVTGGTRLVKHERPADGVTVSTYANGARVVVNYTAAAYTLEDGTAVPPGDFVAVKGAA